MSDVDQVVQMMVDHGMPPLPVGHPVLDGKAKRFGPKKAGWYILREMTLGSGRVVVTGAFGFFQGDNRNTVPVTVDAEAMSDEDRAEYSRRQRLVEEAEVAKRAEAVRLAAGRARDQWRNAGGDAQAHPYVVRKQIEVDGLRVASDGNLLIPIQRDGQLVGLQKIDAAGEKRYNANMDKAGASHMLGNPAGADIIGIGEGYATCSSARTSVRSALDLPVAVAFDAGSIMGVAQRLRRDHPDAHLLFLADDDYLLTERFIERLREEFNVSAPVPIDGKSHQVIDDKGDFVVDVTAWWRKDPQGIEYIEADMRRGRVVRNYTYKNAGRAACHAAAKAVGNASVAVPLFADRAGRKLTDFNDLQIGEGIDAVTMQVGSAILAAQRHNHASPDAEPAPAVDRASAVNPAGALDSPRPPDADCEAAKQRPALQGAVAGPLDSPPPLKADAAPVTTGTFTVAWAVAHCALVQGSTDIWDGLNKLRMKRGAFIDMVGKGAAKEWSAHPDRRAISPRNLPKTVRGVASQDGGAGGDNIVMMLERYTLLYGTKTVYDAEKRSIIAYDAMALARGNDLASRWISHPLHMEKDYDKVVFDPTQRVDLNTHINLFEGFPLKPRTDEAKAELVLDLLWSLCSTEPNREDVFHWVLRWLAYPLQHPGAKMQTALLFFGEKQGTGKSLFFEGIVKPIYGAHGATGGQHQLEGTYTMWRSQKLFVLFEEILSRQDKYSYFGLIKHMITGRDTPISQKFKDDRVEANHMNVVMLSNEFQAIPLEPEDRRFLVVDVRQPLDEALLAKIKSLLDHGLVEAFYGFLLAYPLDGHDAHTKPLMTSAKERVINFGRPDWESFFLAWSAGELAAPWCSCLSTDLYLVFSRYASKYGLRSMPMTKFGEMIAQRLKKDRQWVGFGQSTKRLLNVFHVPYVPADGDVPESGRPGSISEQCAIFRDVADVRSDV
jgi:phage/plasmid primase-like uncharacterized protein